MKKLAFALAAVAAMTGSAFAADMRAPIYKAAPPPPVVAGWTGCYIAGGGGYKMWNISHDVYDTTAGVVDFNEGTSGGRGWLATAQFGCDYQVAPSWVIGAFGDFDWTNARGDYLEHLALIKGGFNLIGDMKEQWSWAAGGRVGYLVTPQLLTFVSGGYTEARFGDTNFARNNGVDAGVQILGHTYHGWFLGSGAEYALNFISPGLFWKTEYRYSQYDGRDKEIICTSGFTCVGPGATSLLDRSKLYQQAIRSELVWRFWSY